MLKFWSDGSLLWVYMVMMKDGEGGESREVASRVSGMPTPHVLRMESKFRRTTVVVGATTVDMNLIAERPSQVCFKIARSNMTVLLLLLFPKTV